MLFSPESPAARVDTVDENLQGPLKELAEALHLAIEESADVGRALAALRERGLGAVLLLEVTVALSKAAEEEETTPGASQGGAADPAGIVPADAEFLRSLRIRLD